MSSVTLNVMVLAVLDWNHHRLGHWRHISADGYVYLGHEDFGYDEFLVHCERRIVVGRNRIRHLSSTKSGQARSNRSPSLRIDTDVYQP
jgi:hypothetical protein